MLPLFMVLLAMTSCAELIVQDLIVNWDEQNKTAKATIANTGKRDAVNFLVYFNLFDWFQIS